MKRTLSILCGVALFADSMAGQYFDRPSWLADVSGVSTDDFDSFVGGDPWFYDFPGASLTTAIGTYTAPESLSVVHPNYSPSYDYGSGSNLIGYRQRTITVTFATPTNAFSADIMTWKAGPQTWTVTLSNGDVFDASTAVQPTMGFFGYAGNSPVSWVTFAAPQDLFPMLDNVSIGTGVPVPEPLTLVLAGGALASAIARRRKRI